MKHPKKRMAMIGIGSVIGLGLTFGISTAANAALLYQQNVSCAASGNYYTQLYNDHAVSKKGGGTCGGMFYVRMQYTYNSSPTYWSLWHKGVTYASVYPGYSPVARSEHKTDAPGGVVSRNP